LRGHSAPRVGRVLRAVPPRGRRRTARLALSLPALRRLHRGRGSLSEPGTMALSLRQTLAAALADAGPDRHVFVSPALCAAVGRDAAPRSTAQPDVELLLVTSLGPNGELPGVARSMAREVWAVVATEAAEAPFNRELEAPTAQKASRVYHPLAVATITAEDG